MIVKTHTGLFGINRSRVNGSPPPPPPHFKICTEHFTLICIYYVRFRESESLTDILIFLYFFQVIKLMLNRFSKHLFTDFKIHFYQRRLQVSFPYRLMFFQLLYTKCNLQRCENYQTQRRIFLNEHFLSHKKIVYSKNLDSFGTFNVLYQYPLLLFFSQVFNQ